MKKNNKGFTLAELLIVVAIIAVLVAISIPIFTTQLEYSRETTDAANMRSAYAEIMSMAIQGQDLAADKDYGNYVLKARTGSEGSYVYSAVVTLKQKQGGWQNTSIGVIGGVNVTDSTSGPLKNIDATKTVLIKYTQGVDKPDFSQP